MVLITSALRHYKVTTRFHISHWICWFKLQ